MRRLDKLALRDAVRAAVTEAWARFEREHPTDRAYGLGLYTTELAEYVRLTIFSEKGLDQVAEEYALRDGGGPSEEKWSLRWSPCDSPHHLWCKELFEPAQLLLDAAPDPYRECAESDARVKDALDAFVEALQSVDGDGVFGDSRGGMVLAVWMGDQDEDELVAFARRLNPRAVAERFEAELFADEPD